MNNKPLSVCTLVVAFHLFAGTHLAYAQSVAVPLQNVHTIAVDYEVVESVNKESMRPILDGLLVSKRKQYKELVAEGKVTKEHAEILLNGIKNASVAPSPSGGAHVAIYCNGEHLLVVERDDLNQQIRRMFDGKWFDVFTAKNQFLDRYQYPMGILYGLMPLLPVNMPDFVPMTTSAKSLFQAVDLTVRTSETGVHYSDCKVVFEDPQTMRHPREIRLLSHDGQTSGKWTYTQYKNVSGVSLPTKIRYDDYSRVPGQRDGKFLQTSTTEYILQEAPPEPLGPLDFEVESWLGKGASINDHLAADGYPFYFLPGKGSLDSQAKAGQIAYARKVEEGRPRFYIYVLFALSALLIISGLYWVRKSVSK